MNGTPRNYQPGCSLSVQLALNLAELPRQVRGGRTKMEREERLRFQLQCFPIVLWSSSKMESGAGCTWHWFADDLSLSRFTCADFVLTEKRRRVCFSFTSQIPLHTLYIQRVHLFGFAQHTPSTLRDAFESALGTYGIRQSRHETVEISNSLVAIVA